MPLVYQQNINDQTKLGVWHITEDEDFFLQQVPLQNSITHPHKRLQHLAGRLILTQLFDNFPLELIRIADTRKPFLEEEEFHFSISHCGNYAAAIVSSYFRVGVDIELPTIKVERIKHKFLDDDEVLILFETGFSKIEFLTLGWCIKESIFKWYGTGQLDFKKHMEIVGIQVQGIEFTAECILRKNDEIRLQLKGMHINENFLTWLVT